MRYAHIVKAGLRPLRHVDLAASLDRRE